MDNDYISITGYKFKNSKNKMARILKSIFGSGQATCGLDSNGVIYISGSKNYFLKSKEEIIDFYNYLDSLDNINEDQKEYLKKFYEDFSYEDLLLYENIYKIRIKLKDFYIKLKDYKNEFRVNVELIIYENNLFYFIFSIKIPNKINYIDFQYSLLYEALEYIIMPNEYLDYSNVEYTPKQDELVKLITPHFFNIFIDDFFYIINNNDKFFIKQQRSSILINKKSVKKQDIYKLLYQSNLDIKESNELKDYRLANDYCHYSDQILSVLIGKQVSSEIRWIILLDTIIIHDLLEDNTCLNNIYDNSYSLKELLQIQEKYERKTSFKNHFPLVEGNNYINSIFNMLNKYDVNNAISNAVERRKEERQNKKELFLSIIGCILAIPTLYDYIIEPMIIWIYNIKKHENILTKIPSPYSFIIIFILLIISFIVFFIISYLIDNKKRK